MALWFRHAGPGLPFLWERGPQPAARWHGPGEGPAQYLASTPDGAWAEFLRHEEIVDPADLPGIERSLWAVEVDDEILATAASPPVDLATATGDRSSYPACQAAATGLLAAGADALCVRTAALEPGGARGQRVQDGLVEGEPCDGETLVLFGPRPELRGWRCVARGAPDERVLALTRQF